MSGQDNGAVALKPCPFCGDTMFLTIASSRFTETLAGWQVECGCHIYGPFERTREEAITAWNTRPTPAQEQGWMPIETAPRDGWKILATDRFHQERTWVVWWKGNEWVCDHHNGRVVGLTDWRPLPSTPTEGGEDA